MNARTHTHPFRVERVSDPESDHGQHKTEAGARTRIRRLVAMSNGKRTLADYRVVNDMNNDTQTRNILAVIHKAERDGVVIDDGNVVDLIADNITNFATLNEIRAALVRAGLASRFPRATRQRNPKRRKKTARKNPMKRQQGDREAARELLLYADNESALYPQKQAIQKNLLRKYRAGKFDDGKAVKLWRYWIDNAARRYGKEFSTGSDWNVIFTVPTRDMAAAMAMMENRHPMLEGEHDYLLPKKNPRKRARKKVRTKSRRYKITAQNKGKKMHFDGRNFSERPTVKSFALAEDAKQTALALIRRYPILRKYRVRVESFP